MAHCKDPFCDFEDCMAHDSPPVAPPPASQFRKRPVVISAEQWSGPGQILITTLEGVMTAQPGDWIITGVKGERYPCKPDVFALTYEPVTPPPASERHYALNPDQEDGHDPPASPSRFTGEPPFDQHPGRAASPEPMPEGWFCPLCGLLMRGQLSPEDVIAGVKEGSVIDEEGCCAGCGATCCRMSELRALLATQGLAVVDEASAKVLEELADVPGEKLDAVLGNNAHEWLKRICVRELARREKAKP